MSRSRGNPLALAVLACLWERPMYPYEITTTLRDRGKDDSIRLNFGALYSVIATLEKRGMIAQLRVERGGNRPERVVYEITDRGRLEADAWERELLELPAKEYPAIEAGLSLIALVPPDEAAALLRSRVRRLEREIATSEQTLAGLDLPELFVIENDFALAMHRAERDLCERYADRLERSEIGGQAAWAALHRRLAEGASVAEVRSELEGVVAEPD